MACLKKGCLQLYCGDGKGKTTASVGLAVRAVGTGLKVLFCQVMKDGTSGEIKMLQKLGITYLCCPEHYGFFWNMSDEQKKEAQQSYTALFRKAWDMAVKEGYADRQKSRGRTAEACRLCDRDEEDQASV